MYINYVWHGKYDGSINYIGHKTENLPKPTTCTEYSFESFIEYCEAFAFFFFIFIIILVRLHPISIPTFMEKLGISIETYVMHYLYEKILFTSEIHFFLLAFWKLNTMCANLLLLLSFFILKNLCLLHVSSTKGRTNKSIRKPKKKKGHLSSFCVTLIIFIFSMYVILLCDISSCMKRVNCIIFYDGNKNVKKKRKSDTSAKEIIIIIFPSIVMLFLLAVKQFFLAFFFKHKKKLNPLSSSCLWRSCCRWKTFNNDKKINRSMIIKNEMECLL